MTDERIEAGFAQEDRMNEQENSGGAHAGAFTAREWMLALAAVAAASLGLQSTVFGSGMGLGVTAFTLLMMAVGYAYIRATGARPSKASYLYMALTAAAAGLYTANGAYGGLRLPRFAMLCALYAYWLCAAGGTLNDKSLAPSAARDALYALVGAPLGGLGATVRGLTAGLRGKRSIPLILVGLIIALPMTVLAITLLSDADAVFAGAVENVTAWFTRDIGSALWRVPLTAAFALVLLSGWLRVAGDKRRAGKTRAPQRFIPHIVPMMVILLLCAVYIAFFAAQAISIAQVARAGRDDAFSYSEFARSGFFQLCVVCGINFGVVLVANCLSDDGKTAMRVLMNLLCACTLLLIASAVLKMALYIGMYGLTPLRVMTTWFMLTLAVAFAAVICSKWMRGVPVFKITVMTLCVSFIALCYLNPAKLSADYNADAYLKGTLPAFDAQAYEEGAPCAADAVARVYAQTQDEALKTALKHQFEAGSKLHIDPLALNLNLESLHAADVYQYLKLN